MSGKNQFPTTLNWQSTNPQTGFRPVPAQWGGGSQPSGVVDGVMSGTNTIYSNIIDISRMDNIGAEVAWTGTPTGTISLLVSVSGINWPSLTITIGQPAGSANNYAIDLNQLPWKYFMFKYTNTSGSGLLNVFLQMKDLN